MVLLPEEQILQNPMLMSQCSCMVRWIGIQKTSLAVQIVKSQRGISRFRNTYKADYDDFFIVSSDAAREQLEKAAEVIGIVEAHLQRR